MRERLFDGLSEAGGYPTRFCADISAMLGVKSARARQLLGEMVEDGAVSTEGGNRNRIYRLKS